jgi:phosphoribosylanthranilate isomerase
MLATYMAAYDQQMLPRVKIKICGVRQPGHAVVAARAGADMVGVVFAKSKRQVTVDEARAIRRALDALSAGQHPLLVGVFVNEAPARLAEVAVEVGLDAVQMSGDEPPGEVAALAGTYPVLKALRFTAHQPAEKALAVIDGYAALGLGERLRLLVDAHSEKEYGGTGHLADWSLAAQLATRHDIILAGGLTPGNVARAVAEVGPWGVDVSSGVEADGTKDAGLIRQFIDAANIGVARAC